MKMFHTYGIFENEADHVIALVRDHAPLETVFAVPCPACKSEMAVDFTPDGSGFSLRCNGTFPHVSQHQEIDQAPQWWRECVVEFKASKYYWREWHEFDDDGNLIMKVSGYEADGCHWTGQMECAADHPDFAFWNWVIAQSGCTSELITDEEVAELRSHYEQTT